VNCQEIAKSTSIAVREIDGASNNSVDNVREVIESLRSLPPPGSRYKIYIIDEVHMLSTAAFNALLKSLEEPPPNTVFIFATTEPHKIPDTVISRCQRHDFRALGVQAIADQLKSIATQDGLEVPTAVLQLIARKAQGGMRDAQSMFDRVAVLSEGSVDLAMTRQVLGLIDSDYFFQLSEAIFSQNAGDCFELLDQAFSQSLDIRAFTADFLRHWRALLILSLAGAKDVGVAGSLDSGERFAKMLELTADEHTSASRLLSAKIPFDIQRLFELAERTSQQALESNFPRYVFEAGIAKMATIANLRPLAELIRKFEGVSVTPEVVNRPASVLAERPASVAARPFNPSWQDFVGFVQSRAKVVLASHLRRVSPTTFKPGELQLEGAAFDIDALKDPENSVVLQECLSAYSGEKQWQLKLQKREADVPRGVPVRSTKELPLEGSIAQFEASEKTEKRQRVDQEARELPLVQSALETFAGSKIDKISVIE